MSRHQNGAERRSLAGSLLASDFGNVASGSLRDASERSWKLPGSFGNLQAAAGKPLGSVWKLLEACGKLLGSLREASVKHLDTPGSFRGAFPKLPEASGKRLGSTENCRKPPCPWVKRAAAKEHQGTSVFRGKIFPVGRVEPEAVFVSLSSILLF